MQRTMESKYSQRIAAATLEELGIKAEEIDKLQTIPYKTLLAAGEKAIANVRKEAEKKASILLYSDGDLPLTETSSPNSPKSKPNYQKIFQ